MWDSLVVPFPNRSWAEAAIDELRVEGCFAQLLGHGDDGLWRLRVSGPAELIQVIRASLHVPSRRVCWETFVNEAVGG